MVCVSQWCNGLCSLVVKWFVLLGGVMICVQLVCWETQTTTTPRNTHHYTTEKHKPLHHRGTQTFTPRVTQTLLHWETQTITPPRNTNHYTTEKHKPLHHRWTQNHNTIEKHKPLLHWTQITTPPRSKNHFTTKEHKPLHHWETQTITPSNVCVTRGVKVCVPLWCNGLCFSVV
jgi:hypothetical protein